jgi:hypothetical protein
MSKCMIVYMTVIHVFCFLKLYSSNARNVMECMFAGKKSFMKVCSLP